MESNKPEVSEILSEIKALKESRNEIDARISTLEAQLHESSDGNGHSNLNGSCPPIAEAAISGLSHGLPPDAIYRYSRHLLLPSFGVQGQSNLLKSSVLVVGAGGLGSPALLYLAACGVGRLGVIDHDVVELNNMHRQIIHTEAYIGRPKVESASAACRSVNSSIEIVKYQEALRTSNALEIFSKYDVIVDATDNVPSRYMISDCCVVLGKPLVSGAALGLEGQLTVYNYNGGPCYRCLFPSPPPVTACQRCSDSGVLGVVPGVIGTLQALEAIKIASVVGEPLSGRMLLFDALSGRIRIVKIRGRSLHCEICSENASFAAKDFQEFDYEKFTQSPLSTAPPKLKLLLPDSRISCKDYKGKVTNKEPHVLIDVRPSHHYNIVSLPNSMNIPLSSLESRLSEISAALDGKEPNLYVVCRRGNDSQRAVDLLQRKGFASAKDIIGGIDSWAREVDPKFPASAHLYIVINILILTVGVESGLLSVFPKPPNEEKKSVAKIAEPKKRVDSATNFSTTNKTVTLKQSNMEKISTVAITDAKKAKMCSGPSIFFISNGDIAGEEVLKDEEFGGEVCAFEQELSTKADDFIKNFYKQLKMQREES
ncbi:hypothetical protein V2J09_024306 [Rumex salicifolius]